MIILPCSGAAALKQTLRGHTQRACLRSFSSISARPHRPRSTVQAGRTTKLHSGQHCRSFWGSSSSSSAASISPFSGSGGAAFESFDFLPQISLDLLPFFFALLLASREDAEETPTMPSSSLPYAVQSVASKGLGAFATRQIDRGEIILSERPLVVWPTRLGPEEARASIESLTPSARKLYFSLANAADPSLGLDPVLAIRATNGFNVELPSIPSGLTPAGLLGQQPSSASFIFPKIARINHSCSPNADHTMSWQSLRMTVYATTPISEGDEINIEYTPALMQKTRDERREILKRDFGFDCHCKVCSLPGPDLAKSDTRRGEVNAIVNALAKGGMDRKAMWSALERIEILLGLEGYKAMPEFSIARISDAYVGFRSIKQQQAASLPVAAQ